MFAIQLSVDFKERYDPQFDARFSQHTDIL